MKKIISLILILAMMLTATTAIAANDISLKLDGKLLETPVAPEITNGRTMVPFRVIFEALGMKVEWSSAHQKMYASNNEITIILTIGSPTMLVNTTVHTLDTAPYISNNYSLVPARAICEAVGCTVEWEDSTRTVIIKTKNYTEPDPGQTEAPPSNPQPQQPTGPAYTPIIDDNPAYLDKNNTKLPKELAELINEERIANDLAPLEFDENIAAVAAAHSKDMAFYDYIDHNSPSGTTPFERLDMAGIYYTSAAENIASGFLTANDVIKSWMDSAAHREKILNFKFTHMGIGYYAGGSNGTYWTLVLVER